MEALGNPHKHLRAVHVAGTNGKGSTALIIARVLAAAGYRTGRYSSPHMHSYCERFEIDDRVISPGQLHVYLQKVLNAAQSLSADFPSEFEILTPSPSFFSGEEVDIAVKPAWEGAMMRPPAFPCLCVANGVDYDHTACLGSSLPGDRRQQSRHHQTGHPGIIGRCGKPGRSLKLSSQAASPVVPYLQDAIKPVGAWDLSGQLINIQAESHAMKEVWFRCPAFFSCTIGVA